MGRPDRESRDTQHREPAEGWDGVAVPALGKSSNSKNRTGRRAARPSEARDGPPDRPGTLPLRQRHKMDV